MYKQPPTCTIRAKSDDRKSFGKRDQGKTLYLWQVLGPRIIVASGMLFF